MFIIDVKTNGTKPDKSNASTISACAGVDKNILKKTHAAKNAEDFENNRKNLWCFLYILSGFIFYLLNYITFIIIYGIIKIMKWLKKFFCGFAMAMPLSAWALGPLAITGLVLGGIVGVSIWRSNAPVDISDALSFFSSCWTCNVFSDVMLAMSDLLPKVFRGIGYVIIPMSVALLAVLFAWRLFAGFFNGKLEAASKISGNFGTYIFKLIVLCSLLVMPLPRMITSVLIEPAMTLGTTFDYVLSGNDDFAECMVATAIADPVAVSSATSNYGAFSPKLRHQLTCEIANIHQITGVGMTVGWTMLNMAFNREYMYKIMNSVPVLPNVLMALGGLLILVLYLFALLPIPLFFLEIFINLSMDLIMLPLMLMAWMFDDDKFAILPKGGKTIRLMIEDVINAVVGIAITIVFLTFSVMCINASFGSTDSINLLYEAISQNDSKIMLDGLVLQNNSIITVVLMGIFMAMFMTMIPQLTSMLFNVKISDKYYETAKNDMKKMWEEVKKLGTIIKK